MCLYSRKNLPWTHPCFPTTSPSLFFPRSLKESLLPSLVPSSPTTPFTASPLTSSFKGLSLNGSGLISHMPEGSLFLTTINKTTLSYAIAIVVAEKVLRIVPSGTHEWQKFISPEELEKILKFNGFTVETVNGMLYNPLSASWSWITNTSVNYALHAVKCRVDNLEFKSEPERDQGQNEGTHHSESRSGSTV
uniref:Uncharacterized protein n=1 Tax=Callorhinchus milii TaxID=7868 RepID=A0A4W3JB58_CALMI